MKTTKLGWPVWLIYGVLTLLPLVITFVVVMWFLPDEIPAHYGIDGVVDRWGSKYECFIFPFLTLPFGGLMLGTAKAASMKVWEGTGSGRRAVLVSGVVGLLLFNALNYFFLYTSWAKVESLGNIPEIGLRTTFFVVGILFIVLGAMMPFVKRNHWFGVRTKWTLGSETVWRKTQRFGGILFCVAGGITLVGLLLPQPWLLFPSLVSILGAGAGSVLYGRREGLKEQSEKTE